MAAVTGSIEVAGTPGRRAVTPEEASRAARSWWDAHADEYQAEHGSALGAAQLVWGPEGLTEERAGLLGPVAGLRVLEVGCGAGQGSRWVAQAGGTAVGLDLSLGQLQHARALDASTHQPGRWLCADAIALPVGSATMDVAFAAYGALQFVAQPLQVHHAVARVLRPGGRWVFSVTHPIRWAFLDDPGPAGLTAVRPYFDRTAYVEEEDGAPSYVEVHRTLGDHVGDLREAGFVIDDLVEPEWPDDHRRTWGAWSPERGRLLPGTAIFVTHLTDQTGSSRVGSVSGHVIGTRS